MAQVEEIHVPAIGDFDGVPVIEVLVKPGDAVQKDQSLVTLESDKATMEVPSPGAGVITAVMVSEGDEVAEGTVIAQYEPSGGDSTAETTVVAAPPASASAEVNASARTKDGERKNTPSPNTGETRTPPVPFDASVVMPGDAPYASPSVRAFARELGVDLGQVKGSGRKGRVVREDVQTWIKHALASGARPEHGSGDVGRPDLLPWPKIDFTKFGKVEEKPLSRIKKISGANLARNWAMIPHVTQHDSADITEMEAFRKHLAAENDSLKVTPLVFLIKAVVAGLRAFPQFNASLDASADKLIVKKYFHIGIAVDTPDGLVVPVIRDCEQKGLLELAHELGEVSKRAREKKLGPAQMSGGCFSISSLGGIGGTAFTPIVNAPEVAILGVSRSSMQPVWDGNAFQPRLMLPLSLSYDHRVIDGADAARFAVYLARTLGDIRRLLL